LALHFWIDLFGQSEFAVRTLSVLVGLLSLIMTYLLGGRLFNRQAGFWAAFFMTISTLFLFHQTEARMYAWVALFSLTTIYTFWRWFESSQNKWLILYALSGALLVHTHITAAALLVGLGVFYLLEPSKNKSWRKYLADAFILVSFLLWFIPVLQNKMLAGQVSNGWFFFNIENGFWLGHITNSLLQGETSIYLRAAGALLIITLIFFSLFKIQRPSWWQKIKSIFDHEAWSVTTVFEWTSRNRLLLSCLLTPLILGFVFQIVITKYLLVASIALLLIIGKGMAKLPVQARFAFASVAILICLPLHLKLYLQPRHNWDLVGLYVQSSPQPVVVHGFAYSLLLERYAEVANVLPFYPLNDDLNPEDRIVRYNWQALVNRDNVSQLEKILTGIDEFTLLSSTPHQEEDDIVKAWLWQNGWRLEDRKNWPGFGDPEVMIFKK